MNCANHPEQAATGFCRTCGKPLCQSCQQLAQGTIFCEEHFPVAAEAWPPGPSPSTGPQAPPPPPPPYTTTAPPPSPADNPYVAPASLRTSPGLAFVLGLIPGVGAVYNAQYAKGLVHAVVFGVLVSIQSSGAAPGMEPLFGVLTALWTFYMAFEAYHTAARRQRGEMVDEFSSIVPMQASGGAAGFPVGPVVMIVLGVVFLLNTLDLVRLRDILRFWPVFLIALGGYMLWARLTGATPEVGRE